MKTSASLLLIDGNNLLYRAAYGFPAKIYNRRKEDITTVFAFFALLRIAFIEVGFPLFPIVCFDGEGSLELRRNLLDQYKQNRVNNRQNPYGELPLVLSSLEKVGIPVIVERKLEADDVIAHFALSNTTLLPSYIMSSDKDFYQLLNQNIYIVNTMKKSGERIITSDQVFHTFGVLPSQWVYFRALMGDPSDFIQGIGGVGPKTARLLVQLSETELKLTLENKYGVSWDHFQKFVRVIQLEKLADDQKILFPEKKLEYFHSPARVMDQLGLWG